MQDWQELTKLTQGKPVVVERVRLTENKIAIEGEFELPPLARLTSQDQVFIMAFVRCEGTIKEMEKSFGVSYPTIKARLGKISAQMPLVEAITTYEALPEDEKTSAAGSRKKGEKESVIAALEKGEISATEAIERLSK